MTVKKKIEMSAVLIPVALFDYLKCKVSVKITAEKLDCHQAEIPGCFAQFS